MFSSRTRCGLILLSLLAVDIHAADTTFSLAQYTWKHRVLVISAASAENASLAEQKKAVELSAAEFADRDMVLVTLLDSGGSTSDDRMLSAEAVKAVRDTLRIATSAYAIRLIGKDGSVKLSNDKATAMVDVYALIDTMPMRRSEQRSRQD